MCIIKFRNYQSRPYSSITANYRKDLELKFNIIEAFTTVVRTDLVTIEGILFRTGCTPIAVDNHLGSFAQMDFSKLAWQFRNATNGSSAECLHKGLVGTLLAFQLLSTGLNFAAAAHQRGLS